MKKLLVILFVMIFATCGAKADEISDWAKDSYNTLYSSGIIDSQLAQKVMTENITREEFCSMVTKIYKLRQDIAVTEQDLLIFDDTANYSVIEAYKAGIVNGKGERIFAPEDFVQRQEMAVMLSRMLNKISPDYIQFSDQVTAYNKSFADSFNTAQWALEDISAMYYYQIINGADDAKVLPQGYATREAAICMLDRVCKNFDILLNYEMPTETVTPTPKPTNDMEDEILSFLEQSLGSFTYIESGYSEKELRVFPEGKAFTTEAEAKENMVNVSVPVWNMIGNGVKLPTHKTITVNKALSEDVISIFTEIYNDESKFPIKDVGGFSWRNTAGGNVSEHSYGTCIDINYNENYYVRPDGTPITGTHWKPYEDPYSIPEDSIVVKTFAKYGWEWGGNAWGEGYNKDYMHFTYLGR